jgi:hypothetical protein
VWVDQKQILLVGVQREQIILEKRREGRILLRSSMG